jgi:GNAT superfamily N-acetyltransferase
MCAAAAPGPTPAPSEHPAPRARRYVLRRADPTDVATLGAFRLAMFRALGLVPPGPAERAETFAEADRRVLAEDLRTGRMVAWLAIAPEGGPDEGEPVACVALSFYHLPAKPWNLEGGYAFLSSLFTRPEHRRRGLARRLAAEALDLARASGVAAVTLHAAPAARELYVALGFVPTNEMRLVLHPASNTPLPPTSTGK